MTQQQLQEVMKFHLKNFNDEGVKINNETIHNTVLSESDGFGNSNSKMIYKAVVRWSIKKAGHEDKTWPSNWFNDNVINLASKII